MAWICLPGVHAFQFTQGELKGSFDSTFSLGALYRLNDPHPDNYGTSQTFDGQAGRQNSVNTDDGNLNYDRGWVSQLFKGSYDLELRYGRGEVNGVRARSTGSGRSMFVRLGGRMGRLVSAVPNIEQPDPVDHPPTSG